MFNREKFRSAVAAKGYTMSQIADKLGINISTLYRKMNGKSDFYRLEIQKLCEILQIEHPEAIFFDK